MDWKQTALEGVYLISPTMIEDSRGYFFEAYNRQEFADHGITQPFVQDNQALSLKKGTLRGLHFQLAPTAQGKLVRALQGSLMDVVVDLRRGSPTYLKWISAVLSPENHLMIYVPRGFGHGYVTLEDNTVIAYKVDYSYTPELDRSIRWNDPAIGIDWGIDSPILSLKDQTSPFLAESDCNFVYKKP